jgi:hypothetical protein
MGAKRLRRGRRLLPMVPALKAGQVGGATGRGPAAAGAGQGKGAPTCYVTLQRIGGFVLKQDLVCIRKIADDPGLLGLGGHQAAQHGHGACRLGWVGNHANSQRELCGRHSQLQPPERHPPGGRVACASRQAGGGRHGQAVAVGLTGGQPLDEHVVQVGGGVAVALVIAVVIAAGQGRWSPEVLGGRAGGGGGGGAPICCSMEPCALTCPTHT